MDGEASVPDFEAFRAEWLADIPAGSPTTTELGRRFANKLIIQWLDAADPGSDLIFCDGAGDGGIDAACRTARTTIPTRLWATRGT